MDVFSLLVIGSLWRVVFSDGTALDASSCTSVLTNAPGIVTYSAPSADVTVSVKSAPDGVELRGRVTPRKGIVTDFMLPARIRFSPDDVARVSLPGDKWMGTGYSFKEAFFRRQTDVSRCAWENVPASRNGYRYIYGGNCSMRPMNDEPVAVTITDEGAACFGTRHAAAVTNTRFRVNRAPLRGQYDRVLVDSPHGPLLSGSALGGKGMVWRVGTTSAQDGRWARVALLCGGVAAALRAPGAETRRTVAFLRLATGPRNNGFCPATHDNLRTILREACGKRFDYRELKTLDDLLEALAADKTLLIVNPYAEAVPAASKDDFPAMLERIRAYVRSGGQWLETAGLSFYRALVPRQWYSAGGNYPGLFADFVHWRWKDGSTCALMGVQARPPHEPWKCPVPFVPGQLRIGGDPDGGWAEHGFRTWVTNGVTWTSPKVLLTKGRSLAETCDAYMQVNGLVRPLADKVRDAEKLERLKCAPLFFVGDNCATCLRALPDIPVPSLIHQEEFLQGGFDKEYPDHLPPHPSYGTPAEMRAFIETVRAAGHLYSPYTNPTWWCDHPRGPTFRAAGEAPLSRDDKGKPIYERYGKADGWTICFWHPAVQAANRKTRRQFTEEYPVDILFQDQCGARRRPYDFNPAAPNPTAYLEGILSMVEEDARVVPLGTEDGWDRVAREQTLLCGLSWGTVPVRDTLFRQNVLDKVNIPAYLWEIEAIPTRLFHDTCLFYLHDLGGFTHNPRVLAWCLGLGYQLSYRCDARHYLKNPRFGIWYRRLHELQSRVVARYAGRKLLSFRHDRGPLLARTDVEISTRDDDGTIEAAYEGGMRVIVNLGDVPRTVAGHRLAPYGYHISGPGVTATALEGEAPAVKAE